jgi:hypothetical protein
LTNNAINKNNEHFHENDVTDDSHFHKRRTKSIFNEIYSFGAGVEKLQNDIDDIIRLTIF